MTDGAAPRAASPTIGATAALIAAVLLGRAVHLRDGLFHGPAFPWLGGACLAAIAAALLPSRFWSRPVSTRAFVAVAVAALGMQFAGLLRQRLGSATAAAHGLSAPGWIQGALIAAAAGAALVAADRTRRSAAFGFGVALACAAVVGVWILGAVPEPHIDVWHFQQEGCAEFLRGASPYGATIRDIYDDPNGYGGGVVRDGRVHVGFQYPPVVFWADLLGYMALGDYRYAQLAAWLGAAALFAAAAGDRVGRLVALVLLFTPRAFFVIESGWPEPAVVLALAAVAWAALRAPRLLSIAVGLFFASRQYLVVAAPLVVLLLPRPTSFRAAAKFLAVAAIAGVLPTLPFALWDFEAFSWSLWRVQAGMPPRADALSFLALWASAHEGRFPPYVVGFALAGAVVLGALLRNRRGVGAFSAALGATLVVFFAFNKFAFCNYYASALAALACAAVSIRSRPDDLPA